MGGLAAIVLLAASGCGPAAGPATQPVKLRSPYRIVTTCGMVTDIVRQVVGDKAEVVGLMGAGVDPHLYKPTSNDVRELMSADLVFYSGLMLEGRMEEALAQVQRRGRPVFAVTEGISRQRLLQAEDASGHPDPHVWMDVALWRECTEWVAGKLSELDPANRDHYLARSADYASELQELDDYIRNVIATIPDQQRVLVTAHDAFGYFSRAYEIPVKSAQGISTESEPGVNDINELVNFLVERKIRAIFVESSVSQANLRAVLEGAASKGWSAEIGGQLFSDAMGPEGSYEGTYLGMLDHNATTITRALGGEAPPGGYRGRLAATAAASPP